MSDIQGGTTLKEKAFFHLPGLFEFYEFYKVFLPLFYEHREFFYDWCEIGSVYGAPVDCIWGGGRVGFGEDRAQDVADLMRKYGISARLTFSNSLIRKEHLSDKKCNMLCSIFENKSLPKHNIPAQDRAISTIPDQNYITHTTPAQNGIIIHSDLLLDYIKEQYPGFYFVSSTTKVITDFDEFTRELDRKEFRYVVPDFRLNKKLGRLSELTQEQKDKTEFLCNECCWFDCYDRKNCYENVSRKSLGEDCADHLCVSPYAGRGYRFSDAMKNPGFIGVSDICDVYMPMGFSNFKIEGRSLGSAILLEFLLHYMTKPEYQLNVREEIYLDSSLDLF